MQISFQFQFQCIVYRPLKFETTKKGNLKELINWLDFYLHVDTNSKKNNLIIFGWTWLKNGQGHTYWRINNLAILTSQLVFGLPSLGGKGLMKLPLLSGHYLGRSVGQEAFYAKGCYRTYTWPHMRKSIQMCVKLHMRIKLSPTHF